MQRKYFEMYGLMDRENLRANPFHHSCIIFLYADCDEEGNIKLPLYVLDSYSFYSHPLPYKKSFSEEPLAFFTQKIEPHLRFRGNFGEWRRENIHDLTYGRGLTGRMFLKEKTQALSDIDFIQGLIAVQEKFLSQADNLIDQEELYRNYERQEFLKLVKAGVKPEEASKKTKGLKPIPEFNSFPLSGGAYSCKTATLGVVERGYDKQDKHQKIILDYINYLRYGASSDNYLFMFKRFLTSFIPRMTPDLEEVIFHCSSEQWQARGESSKYPYCDWKSIKEGEVFAITAGSSYVDLKGYLQTLITPDDDCKKVIKNLKAIGRICEINITDENFKAWHKKITHFLFKLATCRNTNQQHIWTVAANEYLNKLVTSDEFKAAIDGHVPVNLQPLLAEVNAYSSRPTLGKTA